MCAIIPVLAALPLAAAAAAARWEVAPPSGRIVVNVDKAGVFSAFAHDHHFEVTDWQATAVVPEGAPSSTSVEVVIQADSLRDRQRSLSEEDRAKVNAQAAGPEVLDARAHPRIEFRSRSVEVRSGEGTGHLVATVHGTLHARGRSVPLDVPIEATRLGDEWRVRGHARLKQSDLGIQPFSGFAGTVGVEDEVRIEVAAILRPGR